MHKHLTIIFLPRIINLIFFNNPNNKVLIYLISLLCSLKILCILKIISSPNLIYMDSIMDLDSLWCMVNQVCILILWTINNFHSINLWFNHKDNNKLLILNFNNLKKLKMLLISSKLMQMSWNKNINNFRSFKKMKNSILNNKNWLYKNMNVKINKSDNREKEYWINHYQ